MIEEGIKAGKKFTYEDMIKMQLDVVDVVAISNAPRLIKIANSVQSTLTTEQKEDLKFMTGLLDDWSGQMKRDSIAASAYEYTLFNFRKSLYHAQVSGDIEDRETYLDIDMGHT